MKRSRLPFAAVGVASLLLTAGWQDPPAAPPATPASPQTPADPIRIGDAELKDILTGLGYNVKEIAAGVYEAPVATAGLNIPTRVFLSKSKTKLWLSVALLTKDNADKLTREELQAILAKNVDIGPCHFMLESGWLKMKMALDNRQITAAVLRSEIDYLAARVSESKSVWQKTP